MSALPHSDAIRLEFRGTRGSKWASQRLNSIYSDVKFDTEGALGRPLTSTERQLIRTNVAKALASAQATGQAARFSVSLQTRQGKATPDVAKDAAYSLTPI